MSGEWIHVKDRLPENDDLVLVVASYSVIRQGDGKQEIRTVRLRARYSVAKGIFEGVGEWLDGNIILYWLPIPAIPQAESMLIGINNE